MGSTARSDAMDSHGVLNILSAPPSLAYYMLSLLPLLVCIYTFMLYVLQKHKKMISYLPVVPVRPGTGSGTRIPYRVGLFTA